MSLKCFFFFLSLLQIDSSVVGAIDDATMAAYIPVHGDWIATRHFSMELHRRGGDELKEEFSHDTVDFQEAYCTLMYKLGVLIFYTSTKSVSNGD